MMRKALANAANITHIQPLSKPICYNWLPVSVTNHKIILPHDLEDFKNNFHCCENFKYHLTCWHITNTSAVWYTLTANILNSYYASVFSSKHNHPQIPPANSKSGKTFSVCIKTLRKRLSASGKKRSVGLDGIPGVILQLGGEAMIPYLARLMNITLNNTSLPDDWRKAIVIPIFKGSDRSSICN